MKAKHHLHLPSVDIPLWWPSLPRDLRGWLPSRGNVVFTLLMLVILVMAQSVGALPLGRPADAPLSPSTSTVAYQGRLANSSGAPLTGTYPMEFRLYSQDLGGTDIWSELWTGSNSVQVSDGLFNVMLGSLKPIPQNVITGNNSLWLGITVGTDSEMQPRVQLGSVPFAVQALTVPDGSITTAKIANDVSEPSRIIKVWEDLQDRGFDATGPGSSDRYTADPNVTLVVPTGKAYYYSITYRGHLSYFYSERVGTNQTFYAAWSTMLWAGAQQVAWTPDMIHTGYLPSWQALGSNHYWLTPFETTWLIRLEEGTYPLTIHWRGYSADLMYKAHLGRQDIQVVRLY